MLMPSPRAFAAVVLVGLAACQPATGSNAPSASSLTATSSSPGTSEASSASGVASPGIDRTDTAWGRIWDALPADFPMYSGATPAEEAASGPASAVLAVQGTAPRTIADWMQSKLEQASYTTEARSGPLEDGSFVLDLTGAAPDCRVQVSIAPLGGLTTVMVLYGAGCPEP